jgi:ribosome-associated protein
MSNIIEISANLRLPEYELVFSFARSSGKGGQNVNKVNSKAVLNWAPAQSRFISAAIKERFCEKYANQISQDGVLVIHSDRYRDQPMNIKDCIDKLKSMLRAVEFAPKKRFKTKPTKASRRRRIEGKKINSEKKQLRKRIA